MGGRPSPRRGTPWTRLRLTAHTIPNEFWAVAGPQAPQRLSSREAGLGSAPPSFETGVPCARYARRERKAAAGVLLLRVVLIPHNRAVGVALELS